MKWNASQCVGLPVQWHIIQSCIHRGLTPKLHARLEKKPERKYSRYRRCLAPFLVFAPGDEADWLTYIFHHFNREPKGMQQKGDPWWPFLHLSSYILASIQILTLNIPVGHKLLQYNLIQIVTMRSSIKQRRQNHSILVREELLQSSFFLSACFMATICRGFLVTSRRLLKQLHVLVIRYTYWYYAISYRGSNPALPAPWFEVLPILPWGHPHASWRLSSIQ